MSKALELILFGSFTPPESVSRRIDRIGLRDYALKVHRKLVPVKQAVETALSCTWQSVSDFVEATAVGSTSIRYHLDLMVERKEIECREIKGKGGKFLRQYRRKP